MRASAHPRILIAGVGHRLWRDLSAGIDWFEKVKALPWPEEVTVEDYGFGAIAMMQRLEDDRYDMAVFLTAEVRGRPPGSLHVYRAEKSGETLERIQAYVGEAGSGVVAIDPLLVIAEHFNALPPETWVVEVEPLATGWGEELSDEVKALFPEALRRVEQLVAMATANARATTAATPRGAPS